MGKYNGVIVTSAGQSLIANAVASNQKIIFTKLKASTHVYASTTDFEAMTSIADIVQSVDISYAGVYNNNVIQVSGRFTNTGVATAFAINTIGLYGKVGSGAETLVAVVTAVNADTMPVADPVSPTSIIYNIQMTVQNSGVMEVEVNDAGTINVHQFNDALYSTAAITVPTTGWTASGSQYTKTIDVGGITSSSMPFVELQYPDNVTATQKKAIDKAASKLVSLTTTNYGQVVLTATEVPTTSFNLLLRGLGSGQYTQPYNEFFTTVLDKEPYVSREARDGLVKLNLVGGTVAWNQVVQNGNFADTSGWSNSTPTSLAVNNNEAIITVTSLSAQEYSYHIIQANITRFALHKYLVLFDVKLPYVGDFKCEYPITIITNIAKANEYVHCSYIVNSTSDGNRGLGLFPINTGQYQVGDSWKIRNVHIHDLTQMFGTTIADYVYSLEQATKGSGIAWLKSYGFFTKDYYAYDAGSLQSVCTSGRKITALDGTVRNYPIDNEELRGLFKLDTNNKLYCDGDIYKSSGAVTKKFEIVTFDGSDDENWSKYEVGSASSYAMQILVNNFKNLGSVKSNILPSIPEKATWGDYDTFISYLSSPNPSNRKFVTGIRSITTVADWRTYLASHPLQVVYEMENESASYAHPYINPQRSEGTEEFVDGLTRDVMIPVGNESTYYLSEVLPSASEYTDARVDEVIDDLTGLQSDLADTNNMIAPAWSATETYKAGDIVRYNGDLYKAKSSNSNTLPTNTSHWLPGNASNFNPLNNFRYVGSLNSNNKTINGQGLYLILGVMGASEEGKIDVNMVIDFVYVSGNRYNYNKQGSGELYALFDGVSNNTITFNITQTWQNFTVYRLTAS